MSRLKTNDEFLKELYEKYGDEWSPKEYEEKHKDVTDINVGRIRVGDEVRYKDSKKSMIVISIRQDLANDGYSFDAICDDGEAWKDGTLAFVEKTGRHFPQIEDVLAQMREDNNG